MRYLSVCSGIEAATVAWRPLGWKAAAFSEIEAFPRAVLAHHYPNTPLHGDFTTIGGADYGSIDLLVGGTPCPDFSVAGLRAGLDGECGNLTLEFSKLAYRKRPRWFTWENVPGVLSTNGGVDFGAILASFSGHDGAVFATPEGGWRNSGIVVQAEEKSFGLAWRVLDAQFFGIPQRRSRVFVVGYIGDWRSAAAVLFERHSLSGHPSPRREAGQSVAGTIGGSSQSGGFRTTDLDNNGAFIPEIASTLETTCHDYSRADGFNMIARRPTSVRRLTPREVERCFGFPDDYTLIPYRGRVAARCPDGPRYKSLGNSMGVPVMRWIGERIDKVEALQTSRAEAA